MTLLRRKSSLSEKLKEAVTDLSIDLFGYEKTVTKNIISHTDTYAEKLRIPKEQMHLKIFLSRGIIRAFLYNNQRALLVLTPKELAAFFMDGSLVVLDHSIPEKVSQGVSSYLKDFAREQHIPVEYLRIRIEIKKEQIRVNALSYDTHIETIPLKQLIKYFKK